MDKEKREQDKHKSALRNSLQKLLLPCSMEEVFCRKSLLLLATSLIIAFLLTPSFTVENTPYRLGEIADKNIKARHDFLIEDEHATAKRREEAVKQSPTVYDLDEGVERQALNRLEIAFQSMRDSRPPPLTPGLNRDLLLGRALEPPFVSIAPSPLEITDAAQFASQRKKDLEGLFGFPMTDDVFEDLAANNFDEGVQLRVSQLLKTYFEAGIVTNKAWLLQGHGENLVIRKTGSHEEYLLPPPHTFPDVDEARKLARMQAMEQGKDVKEMMTIAYLVNHFLQPNMVFNLEETQARREQAYASVKPAFIKLMRNEMLVREGQRIGPEELLRLKVHEQGKPSRHWSLIFLSIFIFSCLSTWIFVHVARLHLPSFRMDMQDFIFLGIMLIFLLSLGRFSLWLADIIGEGSPHLVGKTLLYSLPLSAGAMIASIFFGVNVALIFSLLMNLFAAMLFGKDFGLFFYFLIGCFVAAHGVSSCRNRMVPIKAGLYVGCVNIVLILLTSFLQEQMVFFRVVMNAFFGLSGGIFAGILVTGITPLAEMAFGYTTDIKLLELATMDQPLLQELMVQAPGTYHHSIIVGNMVEASAKSIGANSLMAKVAAYYHDIGKIRKPLYFIENQFDCENRHEKLAPSMSSLILISHVKEGVELARQHRLGKDIIDIISQHHGKSFISFFYKKAIEAREKKLQAVKGIDLPPINADDYRYPGPKPQTKEAGLVMLADVVEAACRSLNDPTPARIQGLVNRLINNIFSDGQLEECELTLKDLHQIAKHFNHVLATVHHKRIDYPAGAPGEIKGKTDAPDSGQREPKQDRDKSGATREDGRTDLKRLGIH